MKRLLSSALALLLVAASLAAVAASCSSSTNSAPPQCNSNPWQCPTGQTCWITDKTPTYACLNSGTGKQGDSCESYVSQPGCSDALFCFQQDPTVPGACEPFCDPNNPAHACPASSVCNQVYFNGNQTQTALVYVCIPGVSDGGSDASPPQDGAADTSPLPDSGMPMDSGMPEAAPPADGGGDGGDGATE